VFKGRGRGGRNFRANTHKRVAPAKYPPIAPKQSFEASIMGTITELVHDPGRGAPLSLVKFENGLSINTVVPEGVFTGQQICYGGKAPAEIGNIIPLGKSQGTIVCDLSFVQVMAERWQSLQEHTHRCRSHPKAP
jgi:large subunit ribosomal protein L2